MNDVYGHQQWQQPEPEEEFHLPIITDAFAKCSQCSLNERRQQGQLVLAQIGCDVRNEAGIVVQKGYRPGGLMLIGEAPGEDEVERRKPFVGRAGSLLDALLKSAGIARSECIISNAAKCRPENNKIEKAPKAVESCQPMLLEEIAQYQPRVLVLMGKHAMRSILGVEEGRKTTEKGVACDKCGAQGYVMIKDAHWLTERTRKQRAKLFAAQGGMEALTKCPQCKGNKTHNKRTPVQVLNFLHGGVGDVAGAVIAVKRHPDFKHAAARLPESVEYIIPMYHPSFLMRERTKGSGRKDAKGGTFFIPWASKHLRRAKALLTSEHKVPVRPLLVDSDSADSIATIREFLAHREGVVFSVDIETERMPNAPEIVLPHDWAQDEAGNYHCMSCGCKGDSMAAEKPCAMTFEGATTSEEEDEEEPNARKAAKELLDPLLERCTVIGFAREGTDQVLVVDVRDVVTPLWQNPRYLAIGEFLSRSETKKVFHNGSYDTAVLEARYNEIEKRSVLEPVPWRVQGWAYDTMIIAKNIWPDLVQGGKDNPVGIKLSWVANTYVGSPPWKPAKKAKDGRPKHGSFEELAVYNARDCGYTLRSLRPLFDDVSEEEISPKQIAGDLRMTKLAVAMQRVGTPIDKKKATVLREVLQEQVTAAEQEFRHYAGTDINLRSNKQLEELLFRTWKLPTGRVTKTGFSTDTEVLKELQGKHPGVDALLRAKRHGSTLKMQIDPMLAMTRHDPRSLWDYLHINWRACMAVTGRWTSSPNAQNAPRILRGIQLPPGDPRIEYLKIKNGSFAYRSLIAAPPGYVMVGADYAALEQRIIAAIAGGDLYKFVNKKDDDSRKYDPTFDCHSCVAEMTFGEAFTHPEAFFAPGSFQTEVEMWAAVKERKKLLRDDTKRVVYARNYGSGARTIFDICREENPNMKMRDVEATIAAYDRRFPELPLYRDWALDYAKTHGHLRSMLMGRRRAWPYGGVTNTDAANFPIQSTGADIVNDRVNELTKVLRPEVHVFYQGHDAVAALAPEAYGEEVRQQMNEILPCTHTLNPNVGPMLFDAQAKIGYSLDQV